MNLQRRRQILKEIKQARKENPNWGNEYGELKNQAYLELIGYMLRYINSIKEGDIKKL